MMDSKLLLKWKLKFKMRFREPEKKPAIALVTRGMEKGGLEQVILDLYHGYKKRGYRAYIVCQFWVIDAVKDSLDSPEDIFVFNDDLQMLIHFLWRRDVRTLHYHFNTFGIQELKSIGFRTIYTMHNTYTWMSDEEIQAYAHLLSSADAVVPVSKSVQEYFCARADCRDINFHVINNGVDFSILDSQEKELPFSRESLGIGQGQISVCMVGSFYHAKSQIGMLGVAEKLVPKYPHVRIVFLGNQGDVNYYHRFMEELESCEVKDHIILAPPISHDLMGRFFREIVDIFALPTLHEGNPLVAIEAMYCGCPMVLTPIGISEEMEKNAACLVCEAAYDDLRTVTDEQIKNELCMKKHPRNEDSIVECLSKMIDNFAMYQKMAEERKNNAECYSVENMVDEYVKLIKKGRSKNSDA